MKTAIILAAGVGSRLRPITNDVPKCCVPVAGVPLIRRVIDQLQTAAPGMYVYVVVGYLADIVRAEVANYGGIVTVIENVDYATTNNMESCRLALEARSKTEPTLIINADCIYSDTIVARMVAEHGNRIATDSSEYFEENMKVLLVEGRINKISKALPDVADTNTSIDFYSFESAEAAFLLKIMRGYHAAGDLNQWTEVAIDDLLRQSGADVRPVDMAGEKWVEIDNHEDLAKAERLWA